MSEKYRLLGSLYQSTPKTFGTTNLIRHLEKKHPGLFSKYKEYTAAKRRDAAESQRPQQPSAVAVKHPSPGYKLPSRVFHQIYEAFILYYAKRLVLQCHELHYFPSGGFGLFSADVEHRSHGGGLLWSLRLCCIPPLSGSFELRPYIC